MEECALTTEMLALPANVNRVITPEWIKVVNSEIVLSLPFMVPDRVYKF